MDERKTAHNIGFASGGFSGKEHSASNYHLRINERFYCLVRHIAKLQNVMANLKKNIAVQSSLTPPPKVINKKQL